MLVKSFFSDFPSEVVCFLTSEKVGKKSKVGKKIMSTNNG